MTKKNKSPKYAVRLVFLIISVGIVFFGGLRLFVPAGSRLTGSYDAQSLLYIASMPVSYRGANSCGATNCHELLYKEWSGGAHGARKEQSKCEVCHGPQKDHPQATKKLPLVKGDGDIVALCLTCHQKMKARGATGQPQILPQEHPYPHEGTLKCTQCHNPHSPALGAPNTAAISATNIAKKVTASAAGDSAKNDASDGASMASQCFGCHGPAGRGSFAPKLAGQSVEVLKEKLTKYRSGELANPLMNPIASKLKDADIEALAQFFAGQS